MRSTFSGGIHTPDNKALTKDCTFSNVSIPRKCSIPLQQHVGRPAKPVVAVGDNVCEGQLIGRMDGPISAHVHSSIPGKVVSIEVVPTVYNKQLAIVIEMEGSFSTSAFPQGKSDWMILTREEILTRIREAGVVGLGGAAFPTAVKLSPPCEKTIETLIINGAESDPYLTVDDVLMRTFPAEILEGIQITMKALGVAKAFIGIERNKGTAIACMTNVIKGSGEEKRIQVRSLKTKYPQGAEKLLVYAITKKKIPSRGLPVDIGVIVQNVGTIYAIREAVLYNKPLFERYITVSGDMIGKPGNYKVRIGTTVADIVEECGGLKGEPEKIVFGGPLCGIEIHSMNVPVVKGTSGIFFLSKKKATCGDFCDCIRCGRCVSACPMNMMPCDIGNAVEGERIDLTQHMFVFDCIMCGCCTYVCPAKRPLGHFVRLAQDHIGYKNKVVV